MGYLQFQMKKVISSFFGAIVFYTIIPLPQFLPFEFEKIALWLPTIGILLAVILIVVEKLFFSIGFSVIVISILLVSLSMYLTGGFHWDGAMDTADGLAVQGDQEKSLEVMRDSRSGAFGVLTAIVIFALKSSALIDMGVNSPVSLILAMGWSRWGQLMAIVLYDYLRPEGKGAFLKTHLNPPLDIMFASLSLIGFMLWQYFYMAQSWGFIAITNSIAIVITLYIGWWFNHKLGGHTGDTYGATIEWSEALILSSLTIFFH